jgi:hypothetical protein
VRTTYIATMHMGRGITSVNLMNFSLLGQMGANLGEQVADVGGENRGLQRCAATVGRIGWGLQRRRREGEAASDFGVMMVNVHRQLEYGHQWMRSRMRRQQICHLSPRALNLFNEFL